ncbi:MAG: hypothetical protein EA369_03385 [Bradymonadales bacterium]|nr:MAG: hypothetical protein EA369_03385 [Bradymonadales bacterium]
MEPLGIISRVKLLNLKVGFILWAVFSFCSLIHSFVSGSFDQLLYQFIEALGPLSFNLSEATFKVLSTTLTALEIGVVGVLVAWTLRAKTHLAKWTSIAVFVVLTANNIRVAVAYDHVFQTLTFSGVETGFALLFNLAWYYLVLGTLLFRPDNNHLKRGQGRTAEALCR